MTSHISKTVALKHLPRKRLSQTAAAVILGVTREHLNRVIHGHRISRSLTRRYGQLMKEHGQ